MSRESATSASPTVSEGHCQTGASRLLMGHPKRQQGVAPAKLPLRERLPMSTRNGTSSSANPQCRPTAAYHLRRTQGAAPTE
jgi:hypothetical protein